MAALAAPAVMQREAAGRIGDGEPQMYNSLLIPFVAAVQSTPREVAECRGKVYHSEVE
jgi:hypothetical protein